MFAKEYFWRGLITVCGLLVIILTLAMAAFLVYKGTFTFTQYKHSVGDFLFSTNWNPADDFMGGGTVGALIFIVGSVTTCFLGLLIATPFSLAAAIFMTEISPRLGKRFLQPAIEIFVGIPSVIYGWIGLTVLVPFLKTSLHMHLGESVLSAGIVLSVMIFPTIATVSADAVRSVPQAYRQASYGLGCTRWQTIYRVVLPAAKNSIFTGIVLGLARAFGEALAVSMVIGNRLALPKSLLSSTKSLTTAIAMDMGGAAEGGEFNAALWSMALLLFAISLLFILLIHVLANGGKRGKHEQRMKKPAAKTTEKEGGIISAAN